MLIEAPSQILDLADYPVENREDIQAYIRKKRTAETQSSQRNIIELINENEDNFMYVQQVLKAMADGFYSVNNFEQIPPDLNITGRFKTNHTRNYTNTDVKMGLFNFASVK